MGCNKSFKEGLLFTAMVVVQLSNVGVNYLLKFASSQGLSFYVFILYSHVINTLILLPIILIFSRKVELPAYKFPLLSRICLLGIISLSANVLGLKGLEYASPTLASAMSNLTPAFAFTLAIIFRMEKPAIGSSSFQAKVIGTIVSISGALLVVLYEGPEVLSIPSPTATPNSRHCSYGWSKSGWATGGLLFATEFFLLSLGYIIQTQVIKLYPSELVVSFFFMLWITVLSIPVCLIAERDLSAWKMSSNAAIGALICGGFFGPSFYTIIQSWCLRLKGPVYVAAFKPLCIAMAVVTGVVFLGDALYLGSIIGAIMISFGVYGVIWGSSKEQKLSDENCPENLEPPSSGYRISLLQTEEFECIGDMG